MNNRFGLGRLPVLAAAMAVVLSVAACAIELRRDEDQISSTPPTSLNADPLRAKLEQCRTVTAEQTTVLDECRRAWSENRTRFLGGKNTRATPQNPVAESSQSSTPLIKDQSSLPKGYPSVAPRESE